MFDPALAVFPPAFVVHLPDAAAARWVQASVAYSLEENAPSSVSASAITTRLPELVLVEVLRVHLASAPAADHGLMAALADPVLAPRSRCCTPRPTTSGRWPSWPPPR